MKNRVFIEKVIPEINGGRYFIKRTIGGGVVVSANIFADGHLSIRASLCYKHESDDTWSNVPMKPVGEDRWKARFDTSKIGFYNYKIQAWVDRLTFWQKSFKEKNKEGAPLNGEIEYAVLLLKELAEVISDKKNQPLIDAYQFFESDKSETEKITFALSKEFTDLGRKFPFVKHETVYDKNLRVRVGEHRELFTTYYQLFPRSTSPIEGKHGTLKDVQNLLPRIKEMGFDVLYMPPIHPIGKTKRIGKNFKPVAKVGDPGSPWAIGDETGGHYSIHPELGEMKDFENLLKAGKDIGVDIAMDLAFQCSKDNKWIKEHPEWFDIRPDGTIPCIESPPLKYRDVVDFNFETDDWRNLWNELKNIVLFWIEKGVKFFRASVPHTKPLPFWEWLIAEVHKVDPEVIFLAGAFTSPRLLLAMCKIGFTQSYTNFIKYDSREEVESYLKRINGSEQRQIYRPSFWPTVPDILPNHLINGNSNKYALRLLLASTLSGSYGVYGPVFEYMENEALPNGKEEYANSEKYEIRHWDWTRKTRITELITKINKLRRENPALQSTFNINFTLAENDEFLSYVKLNDDKSNIIWCIASFDSKYKQKGHVKVPKEILDIPMRVNLKLTDLITGEVFHWFNDWNFIEIDPEKTPMHVFSVEVVRPKFSDMPVEDEEE